MKKRSTAATIAIIAGVGGIFASFSGHPGWGLIGSIVGILAGLMGFLLAVSPRVSGGLISLISIGLSVIGLALAILVTAGKIVF